MASGSPRRTCEKTLWRRCGCTRANVRTHWAPRTSDAALKGRYLALAYSANVRLAELAALALERGPHGVTKPGQIDRAAF